MKVQPLNYTNQDSKLRSHLEIILAFSKTVILYLAKHSVALE